MCDIFCLVTESLSTGVSRRLLDQIQPRDRKARERKKRRCLLRKRQLRTQGSQASTNRKFQDRIRATVVTLQNPISILTFVTKPNTKKKMPPNLSPRTTPKSSPRTTKTNLIERPKTVAAWAAYNNTQARFREAGRRCQGCEDGRWEWNAACEGCGRREGGS